MLTHKLLRIFYIEIVSPLAVPILPLVNKFWCLAGSGPRRINKYSDGSASRFHTLFHLLPNNSRYKSFQSPVVFVSVLTYTVLLICQVPTVGRSITDLVILNAQQIVTSELISGTGAFVKKEVEKCLHNVQIIK